MSKVAVCGAGSWGTAFSVVLADAGHDVSLWARREDLCVTINEKRENTDYLPGVELPPTVAATHDPERTLDAREQEIARLLESLVPWGVRPVEQTRGAARVARPQGQGYWFWASNSMISALPRSTTASSAPWASLDPDRSCSNSSSMMPRIWT